MDPDFGWHIKMGKFILKSGIPQTDPFSYTMPSYPFVDHEWLINILLFLGFEKLGWVYLVIIFNLFAISSILVVSKFNFRNKFFALSFILSSGVLFGSVGIRTQVISWLLFAILSMLLLNKHLWQKFKFFIPLLFLVWANLHGSFFLGPFILFMFLVTKTITERKIDASDLGVFIFSFLATFLNPYGWRIYWEVFMQLSDSSLRWNIIEWMPAFFSYSPIVWIYIPVSLALFYKYRKSFSLFEKIIYSLLFAAALASVRNLPLWAIFSVPIFIKSLELLKKEAEKYKFGIERFNKSYFFLLGLSFFAFIFPIVIDIPGVSAISEKRFYPEKAISYLKENESQGQILSEYGWGGYLIWKYPQKKVFIDGRMPSWRRSSSPRAESNYALKEYKALMNGDISLKIEAQKYNIDTILLPNYKESEGNKIERMLKKLELRLEKEGSYGNIYKQIKKEGWKLIYEDETSLVYRL